MAILAKTGTINITPDAVDEEKIVTVSDWLKGKIDEDSIEETWGEIQMAYSNMTNNERLAVNELLQDKAPNSNKAYKNLLKEHLAYKPVVSTFAIHNKGENNV